MYEFIIISLLLILLGVGCEKSRYRDGLYLGLCCTIFCVLAALRGRWIGNDTHTYLDLFQSVSRYSFANGFVLGRWEAGYLAFNKVLSMISSNPQTILIVTSIIFYLAIYKFIKKESDHYWISIILFFINGYFRFSMSAVRQILAISILIFGLYFLKKKKYIAYAIFVALAFSVHTSALFAGLALLGASFQWKRVVYRILVITTTVITLSSGLIQRIMEGIFNYSRYVGSIYDDGLNIATVFLTLMCLSCLLIMYFANKNTADDDFFFRTEFIRLCVLIMSLRLNSLDRMADYFLLFEIIGVTNSLSKYNSMKTRQLLLLGLFAVYIAYSYIWGVMKPSIQMIWPYKTFWM